MLVINVDGERDIRPGLDHIFIRLDHVPPSLPARTCVGTLPCWESM